MAKIEVEVAYALPAAHDSVALSLPEGATVAEAVAASGILERHPEIGAAPSLGIFGRQVRAGTRLSDGDRVEIYRPLLVDAKEARRRRAARRR